MIAIGVTGMPGSGKSLFSEAAKRLGLTIIKMGDIVFRETECRGLPLTPDNVGKIATELREKFGRDIIARKVIELLKKQSTMISKKAIVIEGIRSPEEVKLFREFFDTFILVAIHAPPNIRYMRLLQRGRQDDSLSILKLIERDLRELRFGIGDVIAMADEVLINKDKSYEEFLNECESLIKEILVRC